MDDKKIKNKFSNEESLKHQLLNCRIIRTKNNQYQIKYKETNITINPSNNYIGYLFLYVLELYKKNAENDDLVCSLNQLQIETPPQQKENIKKKINIVNALIHKT
jgi:hypothetical protein